MLRRLLVFVLACVGALLVTSVNAQALQLGFNDEDLMRPAQADGTGADEAGLAAGLEHARQAGASIWRVQLQWSEVAPERPPTAAAAADPGWSGYRWSNTDRQLRAIAAAGLSPLVYVSKAPPWAEGPGRPAVTRLAPTGTWRPNSTAFGEFATAVAKRYQGKYPDPLNPAATLPRVPTFQGWNEPNLYVEITPQYVKSGGGYANASAPIYRALQNAFYKSVKRVDPSIAVFAASTAPFGDYPEGGNRTPPVEFLRDLLCVQTFKGRLFVDKGCPKIPFDGYAHNPYSPYAPTRKALNVDDATVPDLTKLTSIVKAAVTARVVTPRGPKPVWITELSWESSPDPTGLLPAEQAQYVQGAISVLANQGASAILLWNLRDDAPVADYATTYQSGIFFRGAGAAADVMKPSWTAYRFPITAYRSRGRSAIWGKAPAPGPVTLQRLVGTTWTSYLTLTAGSDGVFTRRLKVPASTKFRAVQGTLSSLPATAR